MKVYEIVKRIVLTCAVAFFAVATFIPFIEYDTGIRCITTPCPSSVSGNIIEFFFFSIDKSVIDIDYYIPVFWFVFFFAVTFIIIKKLDKKKT